jgi:hypothetical protein
MEPRHGFRRGAIIVSPKSRWNEKHISFCEALGVVTQKYSRVGHQLAKFPKDIDHLRICVITSNRYLWVTTLYCLYRPIKKFLLGTLNINFDEIYRINRKAVQRSAINESVT